MSQPAGRARGRARGRVQIDPQAQAQAHAPATRQGPPPGGPRPGPAYRPPMQQPERRPGGAAAAGAGSGSDSNGSDVSSQYMGRVQHRSRKEEPGPGGDLSTQLEGVSISGNGNGNGKKPGNGNGNGSGDVTIGRGGQRGRRQIAPVDVLKTRPDSCASKQGLTGNPVVVTANYFKLTSVTDWMLYQYRVDFNVEEDRTVVRKAWLREHKARLGGAYIFDGSMLFTSRRLTPGNDILSLTSVRQSDNMPVQIEVKLVQQLQRGNIVYLQVFNILVRRCLSHLNLQLVQRNFFDPQQSIKINEFFLELWPGYVTSIRQHERSILMCAEITTKVMRTDTVFDFLKEAIKQPDWKKHFMQHMFGQVVLTDYNNKTYRIDDVDFDSDQYSTFPLKDNTKISYVEYYKTKYDITLQKAKQPLLVSRASAREQRGGQDKLCMLIPELCRLTGLTDNMRNNNPLMRSLATHTRVEPAAREQRLLRFNQRLHSKPEVVAELKEWQLTLSPDLIQVPARVLNPENIVFGPNQNDKASAGTGTDWTRELRSRRMLHAPPLEVWAVVVSQRNERDASNLVQMIQRCAEGMRFQIARPHVQVMSDDRPGTMVESVEAVLAKCNPSLILFLVQNNQADRYNAIKKKCCVDRGIPSQVVTMKSAQSKGVMSIVTKIVIQMNCKVGGAPWSVDIPMSGVMVVGYDACHDPTNKSHTYGAMVASMDKPMSQWFSSVNKHEHGQELSDTLAFDLQKALRRFKEINNALPAKIIVYRDGVGEGQINYVYSHEVESVKSMLKRVYQDQEFKLGYIIVTKRINTRFFYNHNNPPAGTIVDDEVTLPEKYDFFLVSQSVRQGSVAPTSYNVICDNLGMSADQIQRWTYKMTHLYYNWSGTVRVPAPCQYAHKLAFLVSQSLRRPPHQALDTKLYFL